jgi:hypothetical protein
VPEQIESDDGAALAAITGPAPCDNCPTAGRCKLQQLACACFSDYVMGFTGTYQSQDRRPTAELYARLFSGLRKERSRERGPGRKKQGHSAAAHF